MVRLKEPVHKSHTAQDGPGTKIPHPAPQDFRRRQFPSPGGFLRDPLPADSPTSLGIPDSTLRSNSRTSSTCLTTGTNTASLFMMIAAFPIAAVLGELSPLCCHHLQKGPWLAFTLQRQIVGPINFWGHAGLLVESRRGQGDWEEIGILGGRALRDTRPLFVGGQPEVRDEYRASFLDGTTEISGDGSPVEGVTVSG